jgi:hypothetical protein
MTIDEMSGIRWWNSLSEGERFAWLERARTAVPAVAWECFKVAFTESLPPVPGRPCVLLAEYYLDPDEGRAAGVL